MFGRDNGAAGSDWEGHTTRLAAVQGLLIAFEGLDQSGKQTQAELLGERLIEAGRLVRLLSFPAYDTPIGAEIERALRGARDYPPEVMQLLYIANRYEWRRQMEHEQARGTILVCDRYLASSIAYGEAQGLDPSWLREIQKHLPQARGVTAHPVRDLRGHARDQLQTLLVHPRRHQLQRLGHAAAQAEVDRLQRHAPGLGYEAILFVGE